ncbi:hypothetical protein B0H17DRAFT_1082256 [Mycena rosella]|uniref:Uncharacterized protein n=1 Tax=Mycena rosella TaxID=1033263 RepID=A0AAD7D1D0_MYCRO|nr:hypothetical protein B0H17DRAFT_1082256 [Mycena rosella]
MGRRKNDCGEEAWDTADGPRRCMENRTRTHALQKHGGRRKEGYNGTDKAARAGKHARGTKDKNEGTEIMQSRTHL